MNPEFLPFTRPSIDEATIEAVAAVLRSGWLTTGPKCQALEAALSARAGGRPVRLASSATAA
ncbi:MAG TPA: DegT/DnrJ/EryC1/StrS family aminotransferase, partial [Noviherbaspirillum sp.]